MATSVTGPARGGLSRRAHLNRRKSSLVSARLAARIVHASLQACDALPGRLASRLPPRLTPDALCVVGSRPAATAPRRAPATTKNAAPTRPPKATSVTSPARGRRESSLLPPCKDACVLPKHSPLLPACTGGRRHAAPLSAGVPSCQPAGPVPDPGPSRPARCRKPVGGDCASRPPSQFQQCCIEKQLRNEYDRTCPQVSPPPVHPLMHPFTKDPGSRTRCPHGRVLAHCGICCWVCQLAHSQ
jgi:hypothetical protein